MCGAMRCARRAAAACACRGIAPGRDAEALDRSRRDLRLVRQAALSASTRCARSTRAQFAPRRRRRSNAIAARLQMPQIVLRRLASNELVARRVKGARAFLL